MLALAVLLAGTATGSFGQTPKSGGIYRSYFGGDLQAGGLDPAKFTGTYEWEVAIEIYNGLVQFDDRNHVVPDLAEKWTVSRDGTVYTFTLRKGVKFTNGRELTATDVKYAIERLYDPATKSPNTWIFRGIVKGTQAMLKGEAKELAGIQVPDKYTVQFILEQPNGIFLSLLTMPQAFVVAREEVERWGPDYVAHPVGTGPFVLKEWRRQDRIILEANPDYFAGKPYLAGQEIRIIPEFSTAEAEFKAGRLDALGIGAAPTFKQWTTDPKWKPFIMRNPNMEIDYLGFNFARKPFDDVRVRKAFAYAIPRKQILEAVFNGSGIVAHGPIPPGLPGYDGTITALPYNPSRAKKLLTEAGFANGLEAEMLITPASNNQRLFGILQATLRGVGIELKPLFRERAAYFSQRRAGSFDLARADWEADYLDAEDFLFPLFHTGKHWSKYSNLKVDELIDRARATVEVKNRIELYQEAERHIIADMPWVFLWHSVGVSVHQPWVKGLQSHPTPRRTMKVWLDK